MEAKKAPTGSRPGGGGSRGKQMVAAGEAQKQQQQRATTKVPFSFVPEVKQPAAPSSTQKKPGGVNHNSEFDFLSDDDDACKDEAAATAKRQKVAPVFPAQQQQSNFLTRLLKHTGNHQAGVQRISSSGLAGRLLSEGCATKTETLPTKAAPQAEHGSLGKAREAPDVAEQEESKAAGLDQQDDASQEDQQNSAEETSEAAERARWLERVAPPGMPNQGNTCYMNAVLQVLFSLQPFRDHLKALDAVPANPTPDAVTTPVAPAGPSGSTTPQPPLSVGGLHQQHQPEDAAAGAQHGQQSAVVPQCQLNDPGGLSSVAPNRIRSVLPEKGVTRGLAMLLEKLGNASRHNASTKGNRIYKVSPKVVRSAMKGDQWNDYRQQDAHEFLVALLDQLQEEVLMAQVKLEGRAGCLVSPSPQPTGISSTLPARISTVEAAGHGEGTSTAAAGMENADVHVTAQRQGDSSADGGGQEGAHEQQDEAARGEAEAEIRPYQIPYSQALCPGVHTFNGCLQHTFQCSICGHTSHSREQFSHLSLPLPEDVDTETSQSVPSLHDLLASHFKPEHVDKTCDACKTPNASHSVEHEFLRLPVVLALHVKRFSYKETESGGYRTVKLHTCISLPPGPLDTLDLGQLCSPDAIAHPNLSNFMAQSLKQLPSVDIEPNVASLLSRGHIHTQGARAGPVAAGWWQAAGSNGVGSAGWGVASGSASPEGNKENAYLPGAPMAAGGVLRTSGLVGGQSAAAGTNSAASSFPLRPLGSSPRSLRRVSHSAHAGSVKGNSMSNGSPSRQKSTVRAVQHAATTILHEASTGTTVREPAHASPHGNGGAGGLCKHQCVTASPLTAPGGKGSGTSTTTSNGQLLHGSLGSTGITGAAIGLSPDARGSALPCGGLKGGAPSPAPHPPGQRNTQGAGAVATSPGGSGKTLSTQATPLLQSQPRKRKADANVADAVILAPTIPMLSPPAPRCRTTLDNLKEHMPLSAMAATPGSAAAQKRDGKVRHGHLGVAAVKQDRGKRSRAAKLQEEEEGGTEDSQQSASEPAAEGLGVEPMEVDGTGNGEVVEGNGHASDEDEDLLKAIEASKQDQYLGRWSQGQEEHEGEDEQLAKAIALSLVEPGAASLDRAGAEDTRDRGRNQFAKGEPQQPVPQAQSARNGVVVPGAGLFRTRVPSAIVCGFGHDDTVEGEEEEDGAGGEEEEDANNGFEGDPNNRTGMAAVEAAPTLNTRTGWAWSRNPPGPTSPPARAPSPPSSPPLYTEVDGVVTDVHTPVKSHSGGVVCQALRNLPVSGAAKVVMAANILSDAVPEVINLEQTDDDEEIKRAVEASLADHQQQHDDDDAALQQAMQQSMLDAPMQTDDVYPDTHTGIANDADPHHITTAYHETKGDDEPQDQEEDGAGVLEHGHHAEHAKVEIVEDDHDLVGHGKSPDGQAHQGINSAGQDTPVLRPLAATNTPTSLPGMVVGSGERLMMQQGCAATASGVAAHATAPTPPLLSQLAHYRLHGVVCHKGHTPNSGHYISYALLPLPSIEQVDTLDVSAPSCPITWQWWRYDDSDVDAVEPRAALTDAGKQGYLLFLVAQPPLAHTI